MGIVFKWNNVMLYNKFRAGEVQLIFRTPLPSYKPVLFILE